VSNCGFDVAVWDASTFLAADHQTQTIRSPKNDPSAWVCAPTVEYPHGIVTFIILKCARPGLYDQANFALESVFVSRFLRDF